MPTCEANVRCCGSYHTIRWDLKRNKLILLNHTRKELRSWQIVQGFGGDCRCLRVISAWQKKQPSGIPKQLRQALYVHRCDARDRRLRHREYQQSMCASTGFHVESLQYICRKTVKNIQQAAAAELYQLQSNRKLPVGFTFIMATNFDRISDIITSVYGSSLIVQLPVSWWAQVYKAGIAVVDNHFVMDAVSPLRFQLAMEHSAKVETVRTIQPKLPDWFVKVFGVAFDFNLGTPVLVVRCRQHHIFPVPAVIQYQKLTFDWGKSSE